MGGAGGDASEVRMPCLGLLMYARHYIMMSATSSHSITHRTTDTVNDADEYAY